MKIISINKNISLKTGKIAVNLDEAINEEILRKLNSKYNCYISIADNPKIIYIDVKLEGDFSRFIEGMNKEIIGIISELKYKEEQELSRRISLIENFKQLTGLPIDDKK